MGHPDIYASKMEGIAETGKEPTVDSINWYVVYKVNYCIIFEKFEVAAPKEY